MNGKACSIPKMLGETVHPWLLSEIPNFVGEPFMKNSKQCPNCRGFHTENERDYLPTDITAGIIISIVSFGVGLLFWVPFIAIKAMSGKYNEHANHCHTCNYRWIA